MRSSIICLALSLFAWPPGCGSAPAPAGQSAEDRLRQARERMVIEQIAARGVRDERVLAALRRVPRHLFVPAASQNEAYGDHPLPIGHGQTISQPYIVALMTELVRPRPSDRVLEIGTGSGYQAAVLAELVSHVYTIEVVPALAGEAERRLAGLGYKNVTVRAGDGYEGWPEQAPFDIVVVTAAPETVPQKLVEQLAVGGRLVVPVGPVQDLQELRVLEKDREGRVKSRSVATVRFVPMIRK